MKWSEKNPAPRLGLMAVRLIRYSPQAARQIGSSPNRKRFTAPEQSPSRWQAPRQVSGKTKPSGQGKPSSVGLSIAGRSQRLPYPTMLGDAHDKPVAPLRDRRFRSHLDLRGSPVQPIGTIKRRAQNLRSGNSDTHGLAGSAPGSSSWRSIALVKPSTKKGIRSSPRERYLG